MGRIYSPTKSGGNAGTEAFLASEKAGIPQSEKFKWGWLHMASRGVLNNVTMDTAKVNEYYKKKGLTSPLGSSGAPSPTQKTSGTSGTSGSSTTKKRRRTIVNSASSPLSSGSSSILGRSTS